MKNQYKTAKELFLLYRKMYNDLVNIFCQAKRNNPFTEYPELAKAVHRVGLCLEFWHGVALKIEKAKYFQGG